MQVLQGILAVYEKWGGVFKRTVRMLSIIAFAINQIVQTHGKVEHVFSLLSIIARLITPASVNHCLPLLSNTHSFFCSFLRSSPYFTLSGA
jgi:hypothetical protein